MHKQCDCRESEAPAMAPALDDEGCVSEPLFVLAGPGDAAGPDAAAAIPPAQQSSAKACSCQLQQVASSSLP